MESMEQGKQHSAAAVESDPNDDDAAANVVVPSLPPTIINPVLNKAKRAAHDEPQQVMFAKKHKIDVQSNLLEDQHRCQHNKVEVPSDNTPDSHKGCISNEVVEEDGDDTSKEIYQNLETPNNIALKLNNNLLPDHSEKLDLAMEKTIHPGTTSHATGSKTLYLGNLSFSVEEDDVRDFFKDVGEIAAIRFAISDDRFLGYGHIEFTTSEAAQEALKLNKEVLLNRRVKLVLTRERGTCTPCNSMVKYNQTGGQAQRKTVFVRGFRSSDGSDNVAVWVGHSSWVIVRADHIRSALEKHFGKCGEISRLAILKDYDSGTSKGIAFIDFVDSNGFSRALGLDGSEVNGNRLTVEVAKKQSDGREGSGYGGRGWSLGSGSSGGWVRENGSGWGRGNRSIGGRAREDCYDGGFVGEIGYGGRGGRESSSGGGLGRKHFSGGGSCQESTSASGSRHESFFTSPPRRESGPASTSRPESGSASTSSRESWHGSSWHRKKDFDGGLRRGNGFSSGPPRGNGFSSGPPRGYLGSGPPRGNHFGSGPPRGRGFGSSRHGETGFGRSSGEIRSDSSWYRESSSKIGRCGVSGYGRHDRGR